jgi:hypothetical protein
MLRTKQVGEYTVSQMSVLEGSRMRLYQRQVIEALKNAPDTPPEVVEAWNEWAVIAACVKPEIKRDEYLSMPLMDAQALAEAVNELNSDLATPYTEQSKKKVRAKR